MKLREDVKELGQKTAIARKGSLVLFKATGWLLVVVFNLFCC